MDRLRTKGFSLKRTILFSLMWLAIPAASAQIEQVGSEATLDVATWNIEWFGASFNGPSDDAVQVSNVADIVQGTGIDLWAVQEITDTGRFADLLASLPDYWDGFLATDSGQQRIGYLYDSRILSLRMNAHILQGFQHSFASRPPLKAEFNVELPDTSFTVTLINVHMKAFSDASSYARRVDAALRVKNHIDFTSLSSQAVLFLGDFNDELLASTHQGMTSPYAPFVQDPDRYSMLTLPIEQDGISTYLGGGTIDHMIATNEMAELLIAGSTQVLTRLVTVNGYAARTSDHLPMVASFGRSVGTSVGTDDPGEGVLPSAPAITSMYPNPVSGTLHLSVRRQLGTDQSSMIKLVDMLGRVVYSEMLSEGQTSIDVRSFTAGIYALRVESSESVESRLIIVQ